MHEESSGRLRDSDPVHSLSLCVSLSLSLCISLSVSLCISLSLSFPLLSVQAGVVLRQACAGAGSKDDEDEARFEVELDKDKGEGEGVLSVRPQNLVSRKYSFL